MKYFYITLLIISITGLIVYIMNSKKNEYEWYPSASGHKLYPMELFFGEFIFENGGRSSIRKSSTFRAGWGRPVTGLGDKDNAKPIPHAIDIIWYSVMEDKFYSVEAALPYEQMEKMMNQPFYSKKKEGSFHTKYHCIIAGMAPYGGLAIWLGGLGIRTQVAWLQGEEVDVDFQDFFPNCIYNRVEYAENVPKHSEEAYENFLKNGLPDRMLFNRYMQQFNYRFSIRFENEDAVLEKIETNSLSGELNYDYSNDHLVNAMRTKPRKIIIAWKIGKILYEAYIWTDDNKIIDTFDRYYQNNRQKAGELVFEIGKDNNKFRIYLQDKNNDPENPAPVVEIPDEELQILVFKDEWESYRNPSYNRPPGSWAD